MNKKIIRQVPIWVSARHAHITNEALSELFWWDGLSNFKDLSQPWQFAAHQKIDLYGPMQIPWDENSRKVIKWVRILWPTRPANQVEITATEGRWLWLSDVPVRMSWDIAWTPWLLLKWPQWELEIQEWVIIAQKHLHITPKQAESRWLKDGDSILVWSHDRTRNSIMTDVIVRVSKTAALDLHIDTEEWNALWITNGATWLILDPEEISTFLSELPSSK